MLKLTKTGIGLLTKQYRSVLRKCLLINLGLAMAFSSNDVIAVEIYYLYANNTGNSGQYTFTVTNYDAGNYYGRIVNYLGVRDMISTSLSNYFTKSEVQNIQSLNYYYTFRVDERVEAIEFAKELRSNKKEMSSLEREVCHA